MGLALVAAACSLPGAASAATIAVTETADDFFSGAGGQCSLREAVQAANTDTGFGGCSRAGSGTDDTIVVQPSTTYEITRTGIEDANESGDFDITGRTAIRVDGPGFATLDGNDRDRVVEVLAGARLDAAKLLITDGRVPGVGQPGSGGGGIRNSGRLELRKVHIFDNEAQRAADGCGCGGGIENRGRMSLDRVEVTHNLATFDGGGIFAGGIGQKITRSSIDGSTAFDGGGIYVSGGAIEINRSSISANQAVGSGADSSGGGLFAAMSNGDTLSLTNSTVSGNRADDSGGGIYVFSGPVKMNSATVTGNVAEFNSDGTGHGGGIDGGAFGTARTNIISRNTIVAGNTDMNATAPLDGCSRVTGTFDNHNLLEPGEGCPSGPSDLLAADAKLGPLDDNGGPTRTHALRRKSPARDAGTKRKAPATDQRGVKRDERPDIGSYELR